MKKKKKFAIIFLIALVSLTSFDLTIKSKKNKIADVSLINVEALAQESNEHKCVLIKGYCIIDILSNDHLSFQ